MIRRVLALLACTALLGVTPAHAAVYDIRVLVLMVNFTNTSPTYTAALPQGVMFTDPDSVKQYWLDSSQGQVQVSGEVHGWYTVPYRNDSPNCNTGPWNQAARDAATADGVNVASFTHVIYGYTQGNCSFLGSAGGSLTSGLVEMNAGFSKGVVLHEFAHALGLGFHPDEPDSIFKGPWWTLSGADREFLGLASPTIVTISGTYTFGIVSDGGVLKIPLPTANERLDVEYRAGKTYPLWSDYDLGGVLVKRIGPLNDGLTIHTLPSGSCGIGTAAGGQVYDATDRILVHVDALTTTSATVTVTLNADPPTQGPDTTPPSIPTGLNAQKQGKNVNLWWNASTDDRDCSPSYRVYRNGVQIGTTDGAAFTDPNVPRRSSLVYRVAAVDDAGNVSPQSSSVTVQT